MSIRHRCIRLGLPGRARHGLLLCTLLALAACSTMPLASDPFKQPGTWSETGVNDANLRAMVADPHDLVAGKDAPNGLAVEAVPPVTRLLSGQRTGLSSGAFSAGSSGGGGGGSSAGGGGGGETGGMQQGGGNASP